jgi:hypothetical protein
VSPRAQNIAPSSLKGVRFYAAPILLSAFLLFLVQPMLAKAILPWFGGVASVWIVAMLFFQGMLLLGYTYAYLVVRYLPLRVQPICHLALLAASLILMPVDPWRFWHGVTSSNPPLAILGLLLATVGAPYFLLSATSPLIQSWYSHSHSVAFPYRLFALSNLGSLVALLAYPLAFEPFITTRHQTLVWSILYGVFALLCAAAAVKFLTKSQPAAAPVPVDVKARPAAPPSARDYLLWTLLGGCGSALLVTVMNHLCQNVAPIPLLWILPLATYLLTFILCFDRQGWYRPALMRWLLPPALAVMMYGVFNPAELPDAAMVIAIYLACLFVACLFTHGELARRKPHSTYLTGYYLTMALGGAAAATVIGLIAPHISDWQVELPETLIVCGLLTLVALYPVNWINRGVGIALLAALVLFAAGQIHTVWVKNVNTKVVLRARSFYGALSVVDTYAFERADFPLRILRHGWTMHGDQIRSPQYENIPTSYYGPQSGPGLLLTRRTSPWNVGVIGLGAGTLAVYGKPGESFTFYEIDPLVVQIARTQFTYLNRSQANLQTIIGDGRLSIQKAAPGQFNLLAVDAFSGDSIPVHLLTREAFELYFSKLQPDGVVAIHISNRFVDLMPVLSSAATGLGKQAVYVHSLENGTPGASDADWVLIANSNAPFSVLPPTAYTTLAPPPSGFEMWTDDYSNLVQLLK